MSPFQGFDCISHSHRLRGGLNNFALRALESRFALCLFNGTRAMADGRKGREKTTGRLEIVQCPYSLFLSFRKYARMRHKPINQVVKSDKVTISPSRADLGCHSLWLVG
jgi:hypothetical protein